MPFLLLALIEVRLALPLSTMDILCYFRRFQDCKHSAQKKLRHFIYQLVTWKLNSRFHVFLNSKESLSLVFQIENNVCDVQGDLL